MPSSKVIFFLIGMAGAWHTALAAGAWTRAQGTGHLQFSYFGLSVDEFYSPSGKLFSFHNYKLHSLQMYAEYGIAPHTTLVAAFPFKIHRWEDGGTKTTDGSPVFSGRSEYLNGPGDARVELHRRFRWFPSIPMAIGVGAGIPTGDSKAQPHFPEGDDLALINRQSDSLSLPFGSGTAEVSLSLHALRLFWGRAYVSGDVSYTLRLGEFLNPISAGLVAGYGFRFVKPWVGLRITRAPGKARSGEVNFLGSGNGVEFFSPSAGANLVYGRLGLGYGYFTGTGTLRNIYAASHSVISFSVNF